VHPTGDPRRQGSGWPAGASLGATLDLLASSEVPNCFAFAVFLVFFIVFIVASVWGAASVP